MPSLESTGSGRPPAYLAGLRPGDVWLAGAMSVAAVGVAVATEAGPLYRPENAFGLGLAAAAGLVLLWRRTLPLVAITGAATVVVINAAAGFTTGLVPWPAWIALFGCFAVGERRIRLLATAIVGLAVAGYLVFDRDAVTVDTVSGIATASLVAIVAGDAARSRRAVAASAQARLAENNRQLALVAERLLLEERGRLARELHDSLGHTVNVMVLQAGVGRRVFAENPAYSRDALTSIENMGRGALDELDRLLRVLQPDGRDGEAEPFAPTVGDLDELAQQVRAAGRQVDLQTNGVELTPSGARALYRIVQEALTNAVRHTSTGPIRVDISQAGGEVRLDVTNEGRRFPNPVPGRGLINMRERARLEGGHLEAGPVAEGFRVRAMLPLAAAVNT
jgi:signal transduction histidine kinase